MVQSAVPCTPVREAYIYIGSLPLPSHTPIPPTHIQTHTHTNLFVFIVFALVTIWLEIDELQNNNSIKYPVKKKKKGV